MQYGLDQPLPVQYVELMRGIFGGSVECFSACGNLREEFLQRLPGHRVARRSARRCWPPRWRRPGAAVRPLARAARSTAWSSGSPRRCTRSRRSCCRQSCGACCATAPGIFPYEGYTPLLEDPARWAWHLTLPWIAVALPFAGAYVPVLRASMLEARSADWVRTARAKGLRERSVVWRHMLRSSLAAPVSILGLDLSHAFGGYVLYVETIFRVPGVGAARRVGVRGLDLPAVVAMTVWLAITVVLVSALLDVVVRALDPRAAAGT